MIPQAFYTGFVARPGGCSFFNTMKHCSLYCRTVNWNFGKTREFFMEGGYWSCLRICLHVFKSVYMFTQAQTLVYKNANLFAKL
jgi:hypothetical protein